VISEEDINFDSSFYDEASY